MQDVLGIVGGFGGYATLDFFARVLKKFASESERSYPHIIMDNDFSMPSRTRALLTGEGYADVVAAIASSMRFLVSRGGDKCTIYCPSLRHVALLLAGCLPSCARSGRARRSCYSSVGA